MSAPSPFALVRAAERILGSWRIDGVSGVLPGSVRLRLARDADGATLEVVVNPRRSGQALVETAAGAVDVLPAPRAQLHFDPPGIAEFLAPELVADGPAVAGHVLRAIYLPPVGKRQALDFRSYVMEFVSEASGETTRLRLGAHGHDE